MSSTSSTIATTTPTTTFFQYMADLPPICPADFYNLPRFSTGPQLSSMARYAPYQTSAVGKNITKILGHCCGGQIIVTADELHREAGQMKDCYFVCNIIDRVNASVFLEWRLETGVGLWEAEECMWNRVMDPGWNSYNSRYLPKRVLDQSEWDANVACQGHTSSS